MDLRTVVQQALVHAKDAAGAGVGVGALGTMGALAAAPAWLTALGQAVVVVFFTTKSISRKLDRVEVRLRSVEVDIQVLPCQRGGGKGCSCHSEEAA